MSAVRAQQWEQSKAQDSQCPARGWLLLGVHKQAHIYTLLSFFKFFVYLFLFILLIYLFSFPFSQYCARSKTNAVRPSHLTHKGKGKGVMDRALLRENYHMSLGCTVYSHSLKNFKTSFWSLPIQTKTSVFASYTTISYKFKNKGFIKLSFCFLRASSRSHNPGPAAA